MAKPVYQRCTQCGQRIHIGKKVFEGFMARLFLLAMKVEVGGVVLSENVMNEGNARQYARLGDLKYWGLLDQAPADWHHGRYTLTALARSFLAGTVSISKEVLVKEGQLVGNSLKRVDFKTAYGSDFNTIEGWINDWRNQ